MRKDHDYHFVNYKLLIIQWLTKTNELTIVKITFYGYNLVINRW